MNPTPVSIRVLPQEYPGADAELLSDDHRLTLARYLDWYGIDGVLEAVARISGIGIGMRLLTEQEKRELVEHCNACDNAIDYVTGTCPHCEETES